MALAIFEDIVLVILSIVPLLVVWRLSKRFSSWLESEGYGIAAEKPLQQPSFLNSK